MRKRIIKVLYHSPKWNLEGAQLLRSQVYSPMEQTIHILHLYSQRLAPSSTATRSEQAPVECPTQGHVAVNRSAACQSSHPVFLLVAKGLQHQLVLKGILLPFWNAVLCKRYKRLLSSQKAVGFLNNFNSKSLGVQRVFKENAAKLEWIAAVLGLLHAKSSFFFFSLF